MPGLAKTLLVSVLSKIDRPAVRPHPVHRSTCCRPTSSARRSSTSERTSSAVHKGPVFTNLLLADEINRAAPKVQGALLEAMQERKVTIGNETFKLPAPFLVIATQNPIEQSGTFELPEAQLDRFMLCHRLDYPDAGGRERNPASATPRWACAAKTAARSCPNRVRRARQRPGRHNEDLSRRWRRCTRST